MMLSIEKASINFGGVHALKNVTFHVEEGSIKAIIGPNGAGKTTLFNLISGFYPPVTGTLVFRDKEIQGLKPHQVASLGINRTFQIEPFPSRLNSGSLAKLTAMRRASSLVSRLFTGRRYGSSSK